MKKALAALVLVLATLSASIIAVPAVGAHTSAVNDSYRDQARRLYRTTLGREGEPAGVEYWAGILAEGYPPIEVARFYLGSDEAKAKSSGDIIVDAYRGALGRAPDAEGYAYWASLNDPVQAVRFITDSEEHVRITGTLPPPSAGGSSTSPAAVGAVNADGFVDAGHGVLVPPILLQIRWCESRDNYTAANKRSSARGAYQFLSGSWKAYGHAARYGVSTASQATPAQQDEAALITWQRDGTRPWNASKHCWG